MLIFLHLISKCRIPAYLFEKFINDNSPVAQRGKYLETKFILVFFFPKYEFESKKKIIKMLVKIP
jgi:hypothetical protein